jgi:hypothetical protein
VKAWDLIRDVLFTGTGIFLAIQQAYSAHPNDAVLIVAMGFAVPAASSNVKAILSSPGASSSSRSASGSSSSSSPLPSEGSGERAGL